VSDSYRDEADENPTPDLSLGATVDGLLGIHCPECGWEAEYASLNLAALNTIAREHCESHAAAEAPGGEQ
jgi:hypothetical protein